MNDEMPEAYKLGWIPFLGLKIYLDSRPLIPRPETEWWTEQLILEIEKTFLGDAYFSAEKSLGLGSTASGTSQKSFPVFSVLDLCAGSGAIGCAVLKHFPTAEVYFGEIDPSHEATIRKNIIENGLDEKRAHIGIGDLFAPFGDTRFDFIASNPPYIPDDRELPPSVVDYEPALALRAGKDGLEIIGRIAEKLPRYLSPSGQTWIECDSMRAYEAAGLFVAQGFVAKVRVDQYDVPRIIVISFP